MNGADTAWMLVATALVLLMTPALAFFYGGLVRSKNALNTMMMSFISLGFVGVAWAVIGYSLALTAGNNYIGDLSLAFLNGVGLETGGTILGDVSKIPHVLYMSFQATFCIITAALISGAIVERMRFSAYVTFITLWADGLWWFGDSTSDLLDSTLLKAGFGAQQFTPRHGDRHHGIYAGTEEADQRRLPRHCHGDGSQHERRRELDLQAARAGRQSAERGLRH